MASWFDVIGEATIADAILDRLVHTLHRLELREESLRKNCNFVSTRSFFYQNQTRGSISPEYAGGSMKQMHTIIHQVKSWLRSVYTWVHKYHIEKHLNEYSLRSIGQYISKRFFIT